MAIGFGNKNTSKHSAYNVVSQKHVQKSAIDIKVSNKVPNVKLESIESQDITQHCWDETSHTIVGYDFNQSSLQNSTPQSAYYNSTACNSDSSGISEYNDATASCDIESNLSTIAGDNASSVDATNKQLVDKIDHLVSELIKNISVLSLYKYYFDSSDNDQITEDNFKSKLQETEHIIELIKIAIQNLSESCSRKSVKRILPHSLISKFKFNLNAYNNILSQYQQSITSCFKSEAMNVYPGKNVEQIRALLDEIETPCASFIESQYETIHGAQDRDEIIKYLQSKARDIQCLEESSIRLNGIYQELYTVLSKRGEQLSSLEHQILLSSGCIDKGKMDIQEAYKYRKSGWKKLVYFAALIVITCFLISLPNILPYIISGARSL